MSSTVPWMSALRVTTLMPLVSSVAPGFTVSPRAYTTSAALPGALLKLSTSETVAPVAMSSSPISDTSVSAPLNALATQPRSALVASSD